jgi:hypothetical protein
MSGQNKFRSTFECGSKILTLTTSRKVSHLTASLELPLSSLVDLLTASGIDFTLTSISDIKLGSTDGEDALPLEPVSIDHLELTWSDGQQEFAMGVKKRLDEYLSRESPRKSFIVCLDGPPGFGKSSYCLFLAASLKFSTFRPVGVAAKYLGETSKNISAIFAHFRTLGPRNILIWDEIDDIALSRGDHSDGASRERREAFNCLLKEMDRTPCIIFCTTNAFDSLDESFKSRVQSNHLRFTKLTSLQRENHITSLVKSEHADTCLIDLQAFAVCAEELSFRHLDALTTGLGEATKSSDTPKLITLNRIRKICEGPSQRWGWSQATKTTLSAKGCTWNIKTGPEPMTVTASFKDNICNIGSLNKLGVPELICSIQGSNDVNAGIMSGTGNRIILCTDDGAFLASELSTNGYSTEKVQLKDSGWVWDGSRFGHDGEQYILGTENGSLIGIDIKRANAIAPVFEAKVGTLPIYYVEWLRSERVGDLTVHDLVIGRKNQIAIARLELGPSSRVANFTIKDSKEAFIDGGHRPSLFWLKGNHFVISVFNHDNTISFYQCDGKANFRTINRLTLPYGLQAQACSMAFDPTLGQVGIGGPNGQIYLWQNFRAGDRTLIVGPESGTHKAISALAFACYGRILLWGTNHGEVWVASRVV